MAYEYGSHIIIPGETTVGISKEGIPLIDRNGKMIILQ